MANVPLIPEWAPSTSPVTESDFHAFSVVVLHYWANWNLHDREMDRRIASLRDEYSRRICFRSCDTDRAENQPLIQGIADIPTLGCFIHGRWFQSIIGLRSEDELRSVLDRWLAAAVKTAPLDYETPQLTSRKLSLRTAGIGGVIAGTLTFASVFWVGTLLYVGIGMLAGVILSLVAARSSRGYEFRAGFVASAFAAVAAAVSSFLCQPLFGPSSQRLDPISAAGVLVFWWALFAIPGLLGSVWVWEGRRPRWWNRGPPAV